MASSERIMVIDCQIAGVSGDMLMGALIDLGASTRKISEAMKFAEDNLKGCTILQMEANAVTRKGIAARKVNIKFEEEVRGRLGAEIEEAIVKTSANLRLPSKAEQFALNTIRTLISAEKKVHGGRIDKVHFHELGSADTLADIIGVTVAIEDLNLFDNTMIYATPVAVGSGFLKFSHGVVSVPAPATLEILRSKNFPMIDQSVNGELATPTGVSLLVNLVRKVISSYPSMRPTAVGYGAGTKEFDEMANVLRITIGEQISDDFSSDSVYILETNVDDVPGEVIGYVADKVLKEGARDFSIIPMFTKKNRPGQILQIIADEDKVEKLSHILIEETGTLGVRFFPCQRYILARESLSVDIMAGEAKEKVSVKVATDKRGKVLMIKPEYEEVKRVAEKTSRPLKEIASLVLREVSDVLAGKTKSNNRKH